MVIIEKYPTKPKNIHPAYVSEYANRLWSKMEYRHNPARLSVSWFPANLYGQHPARGSAPSEVIRRMFIRLLVLGKSRLDQVKSGNGYNRAKA